MHMFRSRVITYKPPSDPRSNARAMVSGGTVMEGIYLAITQQPNNPFCKLAVKDGIPGSLDFMESTPEDVLCWIKHQGNEWGSQAGYNIFDYANDTDGGERSWKLYKDANMIKVQTCPNSGPLRYQKQKENFIMKMLPDRFIPWSGFMVATALMKDLRSETTRFNLNGSLPEPMACMWDRFRDDAEKKMDCLSHFYNSKANNAVVVMNMKDWRTISFGSLGQIPRVAPKRSCKVPQAVNP